MASIVGGPSGASVPGHAQTGLERGRILATIWIPGQTHSTLRAARTGKVSGYTRCRPARPGPQTISRSRREVSTLSHNRVDATVLRSAVASIGTIRRATLLLVATIMFALVGCSVPTRPSTTTMATPTATTLPPAQPLLASDPAQWRLASDPARLADDLVADEHVLRDPSSSEAVLRAVARRQQAAYSALGRHPEWDPTVRSRIPPSLLEIYDRNVDARRQLTAMSEGQTQDTLPAWRLAPPTPPDELRGYYREAESVSGVGWTYLAAINLIETGFGRVAGVSTAGSLGPMQFLPSTVCAYGEGGGPPPRASTRGARRLPRRERLRPRPRRRAIPVQQLKPIRAGGQRLRSGARRRSRCVCRVLPVGGLFQHDCRCRAPAHR